MRSFEGVRRERRCKSCRVSNRGRSARTSSLPHTHMPWSFDVVKAGLLDAASHSLVAFCASASLPSVNVHSTTTTHVSLQYVAKISHTPAAAAATVTARICLTVTQVLQRRCGSQCDCCKVASALSPIRVRRLTLLTWARSLTQSCLFTTLLHLHDSDHEYCAAHPRHGCARQR